MKRLALLFGLITLSAKALALESFYCPQNTGYITVGMTTDQVLAACGQPLSKQQSNAPAVQRVQVQQLLYNNQGAPKAFYGVWAIPVGNSNRGLLQPFGSNTGGAQLQVDIINNKVGAVKINGSDTNAFSICNDVNIETGDPASKVLANCGDPSLVNNTYINQPVATTQKPEVWIYQPGQYQPPISLTFVNGKLQSID